MLCAAGPRILTQIHIGGPEAGAALEADRALRDDGGAAVSPHQVVDLAEDLEHTGNTTLTPTQATPHLPLHRQHLAQHVPQHYIYPDTTLHLTQPNICPFKTFTTMDYTLCDNSE